MTPNEFYGMLAAFAVTWLITIVLAVKKVTHKDIPPERWGQNYRIAYVPMRDRYAVQFPRTHWETDAITSWETLDAHGAYVSYEAAASAADGLYAAKLRDDATEETVQL